MRKFILLLLFTLASTSYVWNQSNYLKLIKKENYAKAEKKINKALLKKPNDVGLNYSKSVLFIQKKYQSYNSDSAYYYLMKTKKLYETTLDAEEIKDLNDDSINQIQIAHYTDTICNQAFEFAKKENTIAAYEKFLAYYTSASSKNKNEATEKRNTLAFEKTKGTNTVAAYRNFISSYPDAKQMDIAWSNIYELAYAETEKANTAKAYKEFADQYPKSKQYKIAFEKFEAKQFSENTNAKNWNSYKSFITNYPDNSWKTVAQDSIYSIAVRTNDMKTLKYCVDGFSGAIRQKALLYYHDYYTNDGETSTLDSFYEKYDDDILSLLKTKDYEIASLGNDLNLDSPYNSIFYSRYDEYIRLAAPREKAFVAIQRMITHYIAAKNWELALNVVKTYKPFFGEKSKKIDNLMDLLSAQWNNSIKINSVGNGINTPNGGEYVPVISANDKLLYFCGRDRGDNVGGEDIFVSRKTKAGWSPAKLIADLSSAYSNDAPLSVSADGTQMLLFKSGNIYSSEKTSYGWNEAVQLSDIINAGKWQSDAMLSSDGKALLFASTKEGGYNLDAEGTYHGDNQYATDIYVSLLNDNNEWGEPINLGPVINTPYCDRTPFLHPDMKTLYFSSDGHGGLGKLDVYKSTRLSDTCWTCWSEPINMGKEINTEESDWGYKISTDGDKAYFAKKNSKNEQDDIYWLNLPVSLRPDLVATVSGKLIDKNKQPVSAEIRWEDLETGKNVGQSKSDPNDGSFFIVLPLGKIYGYYVDKNEYFPLSNNIDLRNNNKSVRVEEDINMVTFKQMIEDGTAVPINNLFFNFGESALLPYSISELKRVATIINQNKLKVEISGHTDNIGDEKKNMLLSEQRALAVKDFLIKEGCSTDNLITIGYGESKPIATNDTDKGRAKNRRVELKFIK